MIQQYLQYWKKVNTDPKDCASKVDVFWVIKVDMRGRDDGGARIRDQLILGKELCCGAFAGQCRHDGACGAGNEKS